MVQKIKFILCYCYTLIVRYKCEKSGINLKVNDFTIVTKNTVLGDNVNFNGMRISGNGQVIIGDNFHSGRECLIISSDHNYNNGAKIPYDETYINRNIIIQDNVWFGDRVIILGGVTIGEGAIIQAGSVVVRDIPKYAIAGGHPAKVFSERDIMHYNNKKALKAFH